MSSMFRNEGDGEKVKNLISNGFKVVIKNLDADTFNGRFDIYQPIGFDQLKIVVTDENGYVVGYQG